MPFVVVCPLDGTTVRPLYENGFSLGSRLTVRPLCDHDTPSVVKHHPTKAPSRVRLHDDDMRSSSAPNNNKARRIVLVGDSDIARWPPHLYPCLPGVAEPTDRRGNPCVSGNSGATLAEIVPQVRQMLATENQDDGLILVVCAGENDIGQGIPLESSVQALQKVLDAAFTPPSGANDTTLHHLVFLGPKLEPWMNDDLDSKKSYSAMDRAFQRCCKENVPTMVNNLHYVDCLVMFCGETANVSGARLGGKAIAQEEFFDADQLHLNDSGYVIWKDVVEDMIIKKCL